MPEENIKPLYPVVSTGKILKHKKSPEKKAPESAPQDLKKKERQKKGIIDTYA
jgi:hypothetical protein